MRRAFQAGLPEESKTIDIRRVLTGGAPHLLTFMSERLGDLDVESWRENRKVVLSSLDRIEVGLRGLDIKVGSEMTDMKVELATIKTKVALYAAGISIIFSVLLSAVISYLTRR